MVELAWGVEGSSQCRGLVSRCRGQGSVQRLVIEEPEHQPPTQYSKKQPNNFPISPAERCGPKAKLDAGWGRAARARARERVEQVDGGLLLALLLLGDGLDRSAASTSTVLERAKKRKPYTSAQTALD